MAGKAQAGAMSSGDAVEPDVEVVAEGADAVGEVVTSVDVAAEVSVDEDARREELRRFAAELNGAESVAPVQAGRMVRYALGRSDDFGAQHAPGDTLPAVVVRVLPAGERFECHLAVFTEDPDQPTHVVKGAQFLVGDEAPVGDPDLDAHGGACWFPVGHPGRS